METDQSSTSPSILLQDADGPGLPATEAGQLFRTIDWNTTPLGPQDAWPQSLRIALGVCLNSRFPMFVWWGPSLVNLYNDAYIPVLGKRHPTAFGRPARETWADIWDVVGPQAEQVMLEGRPTWNQDVLLVMERNGYPEDTYFTWSYSPIYDDDGSIGGLFCACQEETARVVAERERDRLIRQAQDAMQTLKTWFDQAPGFVALLKGPDFVFDMVNDAYLQLVGHRGIEGRPAFEALPDLRNQGYEELLQRVYVSGEPFIGRGLRLQVQESPGDDLRERYVDLIYQPVRNTDGAVTGIFAQGHDVTEQVLAVNALKEADQRKDEFLATLAHELRNPLAPIRQAVAVAKSPAADEARTAWALAVIDRQVSHMAVLLEDLLDVSRISRGRLHLRMQGVVLAEVVQAALEAVQPMIDAKGHHLAIALPEQPVRLVADPVRLAQVLSNLLSNAAKYTDAGGRITLEAHAGEGCLTLRVQDTGIGLSIDSQDEIFEMFSQVASALHRSEGGLGIGLALTKGIVELHGGSLRVHSEGLGHGSVFTVSLPLPAAEAVEAVEGGAGAAHPQPTTPADTPAPTQAPAASDGVEGAESAAEGTLVLVADDNADALDSLAALLELNGHRVVKARDGREALEIARRVRPRVAILDIGMPDLSGFEVARQIRASAWGATMPLVALTGWGQPEDARAALDAGFTHHLTKPVAPAVLGSLVRAVTAN
ncbi:ATP-binding protein [Ramlibacter sp. AN1015]|uniref:hybrid sensor histidine kinase/response regulator n=1 Tax=Ramlibacter sp. AN1015 TaxID=3133428 RepID=UPI0030C24015